VQYQSRINGALVLENLSKGATYAKTNLHYDRRDGGQVTATSQFITPLSSAVTPDPTVVAMLQPYRQQLAAQLDVVIGTANGIFERQNNIERIKEMPIGDLVADMLRTTYGTQIAFTNGGGLRSSLPSSSYLPQDTGLRRPSPGYATGPPYDVVKGDALAVLPFGNQSLTRTVTGQQLWQVLEHSVSQAPNAFGGFLQISGFRYTYDSTKPAGSRVLDVTLDDGTPVLSDATTYTAATNDFTNAGGDGYTVLADGQGTTRNIMANDLMDYIQRLGTLTPTTDGRIDDIARPDA
jgi:5'-nucleotidase